VLEPAASKVADVTAVDNPGGARSCPPIKLYEAARLEQARPALTLTLTSTLILTLALTLTLIFTLIFTLALALTLSPPPYPPPYLEQGLSLAARAFVESDLAVEQDAEGARVSLSKILDWYGADFGADEAAVLGRLQGFLPEESAQHAALGEALQRPASELQVTYREYDWGGNDATSD